MTFMSGARVARRLNGTGCYVLRLIIFTKNVVLCPPFDGHLVSKTARTFIKYYRTGNSGANRDLLGPRKLSLSPPLTIKQNGPGSVANCAEIIAKL